MLRIQAGLHGRVVGIAIGSLAGIAQVSTTAAVVTRVPSPPIVVSGTYYVSPMQFRGGGGSVPVNLDADHGLILSCGVYPGVYGAGGFFRSVFGPRIVQESVTSQITSYPETSNIAAPLSVGMTVGPDSNWSSAFTTLFVNDQSPGSGLGPPHLFEDLGWSGVADLGIALPLNGHTYYGWVELAPYSGGPPVQTGFGYTYSVPGFQVDGWGIETTPDTPVVVGAVPEPAMAALFLLAAPAVFRRRRSQ